MAISPSSNPIIHLKENQLKQWLASLEQQDKYGELEHSMLADRFLARFGIQNSMEVLRFLNSAEGHDTLNHIAQELIKEETRIQLNREANAEALLKQQRLLFLLTALMVKNKEQKQHFHDMIQQQMDKLLKPTKIEDKKEIHTISLSLLDENIEAYSKAIKALEIEIKFLEVEIVNVENEIAALEAESVLMMESHLHLQDHLDELDFFLKAPLFSDQPISQFLEHAKQQIDFINSHIGALAAERDITVKSSDTMDREEDESRTSRKMRLLEERRAFYLQQIEQPPQSAEQVLQQCIDRVQARLKEYQTHSVVTHSKPYFEQELEGLRLQERGLSQAVQVLRNEKMLLNDKLEPVNDFSQAFLVIDPNHYSLYKKQGDSFAICSDHMDPDHLSEHDWVQAKRNYEERKLDVRSVYSYQNELMQQQSRILEDRLQSRRDYKQECMSRMSDFKASYLEVDELLTSAKAERATISKAPVESRPSLSLSPRPQPKSDSQPEFQTSYSLMMLKLVPSQKPSPRSKDIKEVERKLESIVPPEKKGTLKQLIQEVKPGKVMPSDIRLGWLQRMNKLIPTPSEDEEKPHLKK